MISAGLNALAGKRVLLLQGPVGPFFKRFARLLHQQGAQVFKVNFHLGDWLYYPTGAVFYRGTEEVWPQWLRERLLEWRIDVAFLFGDMRPVHQAAHQVVTDLGIDLGVFEEGYLRPDHVTLERHGVNANSVWAGKFPAEPGADSTSVSTVALGSTYWHMVRYGFVYFTAGAASRVFFPHYQHHRPLSFLEALPWLRSVWRKYKYRWLERRVQGRLTQKNTRPYFLVPLQVFNDFQVTHHYGKGDVCAFLEDVVASFAEHAPKDALLVIKHHPMDRGYCDYTRLVKRLVKDFGLQDRIFYIHDQHLPTLLDHARGVVVINSTVGLQAIRHGVPTCACGKAMYDLPGLTYQGELNDFWREAQSAAPDAALSQRYVRNLIAHTQINGSFYKAIRHPKARAGLMW